MPDPIVLRVGTRASRLALWQTEHVMVRLAERNPHLAFERVEIRTLGDRVTDVPLPRIGDRGLFTRELEDGLREGTIDFAVHSLKDLPTEQPDGLALGAVLSREDPREALVSRTGSRLADLPAGARLGTSSLRRRAQVLAIRRDLEIVDIRGNVPTRVEKVQRGDYDATLLARAGLARLGLASAATEVLDLDVLVPAPGQGALAVQVRAGDALVGPLVSTIDDGPARWATTAERAMLGALRGGCQAPVGAIALRAGDGQLRLVGLVAGVDGATVVRTSVEAPVHDDVAARALGELAAARLIEQGAARLIEQARHLVAAGALGEQA